MSAIVGVVDVLRGKPRNPVGPDGRMALSDHFREARARLMRSALVLIILFCVAIFFYSQLLELVQHPYNEARAALAHRNPPIRTEPVIQGATGVAGRLAVQIAKLLGAGRIVATGRDAAALESLRTLGADALIDTRVPDEELMAHYRAERHEGFDVVVDYLWGRPTELLCRALVPEGFGFAAPTRLVQIGESAGPAIELTADAIRTSGLELYGAARNMASGIADATRQVTEWIRTGALAVDVTVMPLSRIDEAWRRTDLRGSRLVIVPDRITEGENRS